MLSLHSSIVAFFPESHRQDFVDIAGLRNVLAHRYRHIDAGEIYESYHDLERLERFSEAIYLYLQNGTAESTNT
jgi:uncharacterized protein YutE (UPF0331/DUF86 family)